jgi:uncharacterized protein YecA (UPF0149 family)
MGAVAEAFVAFAQPLLDQTDGSPEAVNKAFSIAQACYNLALLPEGIRDETIQGMRRTLAMDAAEFDEFRDSIIEPMIRRHEEMFRGMRQSSSTLPMEGDRSRHAQRIPAIPAAATKKHAVTDPYGPCPCNSGKKYKFCCGRKAR